MANYSLSDVFSLIVKHEIGFAQSSARQEVIRVFEDEKPMTTEEAENFMTDDLLTLKDGDFVQKDK